MTARPSGDPLVAGAAARESRSPPCIHLLAVVVARFSLAAGQIGHDILARSLRIAGLREHVFLQLGIDGSLFDLVLLTLAERRKVGRPIRRRSDLDVVVL